MVVGRSPTNPRSWLDSAQLWKCRMIRRNSLIFAIPTVKDPDFFALAHTKMGEGFMDNYTFLRLLNYPPVTMVTPTEIGYRCAEHVDYRTFSLLFQDKGGGLQVRYSDGSYINVPCSDDHILMITGRTLGSWTNNRYRPTYHRVPIPEDKHTRQLSRLSMAFFVHPNSDVLVKPLP
ncbi:uncharacterized protein LOC135351420 [Halichondria panicea]|uniref:uncharacterized protein LOC135351420 n=1 Tax=Halichondria panicea TaxID=6063 RepID=UPI00312BBD96